MVAIRCARVCYHALKRKKFGKRLIDHDVLQGKFADVARAVESSQALSECVMVQFQKMPATLQGSRLGGPCALLKLLATIVLELAASEAIQVMNGSSRFGKVGEWTIGVGDTFQNAGDKYRAQAIPPQNN